MNLIPKKAIVFNKRVGEEIKFTYDAMEIVREIPSFPYAVDYFRNDPSTWGGVYVKCVCVEADKILSKETDIYIYKFNVFEVLPEPLKPNTHFNDTSVRLQKRKLGLGRMKKVNC
ncbi:MAG: hypothetical protein WCP15_00195 [bacterium]